MTLAKTHYMRLYTMGWISVNTRLPKKLQKVLFHWLLNGHGKNISMGYMCDGGWNIYLPYHSYGLRADVCPVTHWRELPEFPNDGDLPFVGAILIDEPEQATQEEAKAFAKRFCKENADLLKRLADR